MAASTHNKTAKHRTKENSQPIKLESLATDSHQNTHKLIHDKDKIIKPQREQQRKYLPILLAVNKCESEIRGGAQAEEFWKLGLGLPYPVSGIHGNGLGELLDALIEQSSMPKVTKVAEENATNIAFVGRPNVGKMDSFQNINANCTRFSAFYDKNR